MNRTVAIEFTPESFDGISSVLAGTEGFCFRLNGKQDVVIREVSDRGITVRTIPDSFDDTEFVPSEFFVDWLDVDSLLYH